jgi:hypothetical protein
MKLASKPPSALQISRCLAFVLAVLRAVLTH